MATLKNTTINDTGHLTVASGTTGQRPASPAVGMVRYNTTLSVLEQYTDVGWQGIEAPPVVASVSPTTYSGNAGTTITINGSNFKAGSVASFIAQGGALTTASSTTFVSSSQITAVTPNDYTVAQGPLGISVSNPSGLAARLENALSTGSAPSWTTAVGNVWDNADDTAVSVTLVATDSESGGGIASYAITSGSLPAGVSLNSGSGALSGTPSVTETAATTYSFTVRATDNAGNTTDRAFTIILRPSKLTSPTAFPTSAANYNLFTTGWTASSTDLNNLNHASSSFRIPSNVHQIRVVCWGGGAATYNSTNINSGGYADAIFRVTPQEYYKVIVANAGSVVSQDGGNGGSGIGGGCSQDGNDVGTGGGGSGFFYAANSSATVVSSEGTMFGKGVLIAGGAGCISGASAGSGSGNAGGTSSVTIGGVTGIGVAGGNGTPHGNSNGGLANGGGGALINQGGSIVASSPSRGSGGGYGDDGHGGNCGGGTGGGSGAGGTGGFCPQVNAKNGENATGDGGRGTSNYSGNYNTSGPGLGGIDSNGNSTGGNGFRFNGINLGGGGGGGHGASNAGGGWGGGGSAYYSYSGGGGSGGAWGYLSGTTPTLSARVAPGSVSVNGGNANSVCGVPSTAGETRSNIGTGNGYNGAVLIMW